MSCFEISTVTLSVASRVLWKIWARPSLSVPCPVGGDRLLEVRVLLARDQANFLQCCEVLCGLRGVVHHQVRFADVLMGSAMPGVQAQGDFIVPERFVEPAEVPIRVAEQV